MRVLIAAGGTAGHINPALAIAGAIKKADPSAEIHFECNRIVCAFLGFRKMLFMRYE